MKCKTCKHWINVNGESGRCKLINNEDVVDFVSIHFKENTGLRDEVLDVLKDEKFSANFIHFGANFGCNNWNPLVEVRVASQEEEVVLYGDNRK